MVRPLKQYTGYKVLCDGIHFYHSHLVLSTHLLYVGSAIDTVSLVSSSEALVKMRVVAVVSNVDILQVRTYHHNMTSLSSSGEPRIRGWSWLVAATEDFAARRLSFNVSNPDELRYLVTISVRVRWFVFGACLVMLVYRPNFTNLQYASYMLFLTLLAGLNGYLHYRVRSGRTVTWHWLLALSVVDWALITGGTVVGGGFHYIFFLFYYPALAGFAVLFSSFRLSLAWTTLTAVIHATVSLTVGAGLDLAARDEKELYLRIAVLYALVAFVNLVARFERIRKQEAVQRERELQRERIELSQTIHDTTAQSAYLIGLGIETAIELADTSNRALVGKLEATSALSKSAMWELRHPIDIGLIFEGRALSSVLQAHAATFTTITSVPAAVVQTGTEPSLSLLTRSRLFSIAHNALTNAFRHARASQVTIELDFQASGVRMSVVDDGIGLPADYAERGRGFQNMRAEAERMSGRLDVESSRSGGGTTVTCVLAHEPA